MGDARYFDDGKGRLGFPPSERCYRSRVCALRGGHGGGCDPRSEPVRTRALHAVLVRERIRGARLRLAPITGELGTRKLDPFGCVQEEIEREGEIALRIAEALAWAPREEAPRG